MDEVVDVATGSAHREEEMAEESQGREASGWFSFTSDEMDTLPDDKRITHRHGRPTEASWPNRRALIRDS
jgi:hypothetical protein